MGATPSWRGSGADLRQDADGQDHHAGRRAEDTIDNVKQKIRTRRHRRPAAPDLRGQAARGRPHVIRLQHPEGVHLHRLEAGRPGDPHLQSGGKGGQPRGPARRGGAGIIKVQSRNMTEATRIPTGGNAAEAGEARRHGKSWTPSFRLQEYEMSATAARPTSSQLSSRARRRRRRASPKTRSRPSWPRRRRPASFC